MFTSAFASSKASMLAVRDWLLARLFIALDAADIDAAEAACRTYIVLGRQHAKKVDTRRPTDRLTHMETERQRHNAYADVM